MRAVCRTPVLRGTLSRSVSLPPLLPSGQWDNLAAAIAAAKDASRGKDHCIACGRRNPVRAHAARHPAPLPPLPLCPRWLLKILRWHLMPLLLRCSPPFPRARTAQEQATAPSV